MGRIFNRFFKKKCQHDWQLEAPTYNVGDAFKEWEGPIKDYCTKCGATRPHPECEHEWEPAIDDEKGPVVNYIQLVRTHVCTKCGMGLYEKPE
ncbi:hypothetical protein J5751_04485 [bacterium]|nr:hypothetical protein [bacterium]